MNKSEYFKTQDFSLVLGGPLFQLFRKSHLAGDALELVRQRIIVISLLAWLPLLPLSINALYELTPLISLFPRIKKFRTPSFATRG